MSQLQITLLKQNIFEFPFNGLSSLLFFPSSVHFCSQSCIFFIITLWPRILYCILINAISFLVLFLLGGTFVPHPVWGMYWFHIYSTIWSKNIILLWKNIEVSLDLGNLFQFNQKPRFLKKKMTLKLHPLTLILWRIQLEKIYFCMNQLIHLISRFCKYQ